jgi:hypothetical protein
MLFRDSLYRCSCLYKIFYRLEILRLVLKLRLFVLSFFFVARLMAAAVASVASMVANDCMVEILIIGSKLVRFSLIIVFCRSLLMSILDRFRELAGY